MGMSSPRPESAPALVPGSLAGRTLVFLHIPKTAGQTIHHALARAVGGERHVSPVRLNSQASAWEGRRMPPGYRLYSGHLDWHELDTLEDPFTFTVLREPRERIASFYFYLRKEGEAGRLAYGPNAEGGHPIMTRSIDDYFFGGDAAWQRHIANHYDNFYCRYFATRSYSGHKIWAKIAKDDRRATAHANIAEHIDRVYSTKSLIALENDLSSGLNQSLRIADKFSNVGVLPRRQKRWPKLLDRFESDAQRARMEDFATLDDALMEGLGLT